MDESPGALLDGQPVSDEDRDQIQAGLLAGLTQIYQASRIASLDRLQAPATLAMTNDARLRLKAFAADRAAKAQNGVNARLQRAAQDAAESGAALTPALDAAHADMAAYNADELAPWMTKWASGQGRYDAYAEVPGDVQGTSRRDETLWIWQQNTDFEDGCKDAAEASPAPFDDLVSLAGGVPQTHDGCQCDLYPASDGAE